MAKTKQNIVKHAAALLLCASGLAALGAEPPGEPPPAVQMLVPGFTVRELPLQIPNQNNVEYAADGRLFAAGYDGVLRLLRDTNGDGLEDQATQFGEQTGGDYPLGMVVRGDSVYVLFRNEVARFRDTDGDGVPDKREVAIHDWEDEATKAQSMFLKRRVDYAMGLAIAPDGNFFISIGNAAFNKAYLLDADGRSHYDPKYFKGSVLKISPDGSKVEKIASGVRYLMSLQFNRHGDLLASEQEGATWLPNGNPFDELLHIQPGRHYGFPPRHPVHLPNVIDEPSVFDYAPEHQSICGFRLNESGPGRARFGPAWWEGDALLTGATRGKLYRTKLIKTPAGYVAQSQLIAALQTLAIDCAISPKGDLVVATHTGKPDWGTGPKGIGKLFQITYSENSVAQPLLAYAASPTETTVEFDRPINSADWRNLAKQSRIEGGRYVREGDRFETLRPGYAVVQMQVKEPRTNLPVLTASLTGTKLSLQTSPRTDAVQYAVTLPDPHRAKKTLNLLHALPEVAAIDLAHDLSGVNAEWTAAGNATWTGWLPHLDLQVARELTTRTSSMGQMLAATGAGKLKLRAQLDLSLMLRSATQPLGKLDYEYPPEAVSVVFTGDGALRITAGGGASVQQVSAQTVRLSLPTTRTSGWVPIELTLEKTAGKEPTLQVHWYTAEDSRPRALALRRILLPWAKPAGSAPEKQVIAEIAGGDWNAGKKIYFGEQVACGKCHNIRGEGGVAGPDLSNLIHRDYASVMKDIAQPSAALNPDNLAYSVELKDGSSLTGVVVADDGKALSLADATGKANIYPRANIDMIRPSAISLMPEGLLNTLSKEQVRDLMTFLLTEEKK